jgi:hypothetical protein
MKDSFVSGDARSNCSPRASETILFCNTSSNPSETIAVPVPAMFTILFTVELGILNLLFL